jgi:two-component system, NtrC family, sensor kinase
MSENRRILVVDDDSEVLQSYQSILQNTQSANIVEQGARLFGQPLDDSGGREISAYDVTLCTSGEEGVQAVRQALSEGAPLAVAFIDMIMPGLDGTETVRRIWQADPRIKVVLVTAYSAGSLDRTINETDREDLLFLRKPFHSEEIRQLARFLSIQWNLEHNTAGPRDRPGNLSATERCAESEDIYGELSSAIQDVRDTVENVFRTVAEQEQLLDLSDTTKSSRRNPH